MGFFKATKTAFAENCASEEIELFYRAHTLELYSPTYCVKHCKFNDMNCVVQDPKDKGNLTIVWQSTRKRPCDYKKKNEAVKGKFNGDIFLPENGDFALTFQQNPSVIYDCEGEKLALTDQGIA